MLNFKQWLLEKWHSTTSATNHISRVDIHKNPSRHELHKELTVHDESKGILHHDTGDAYFWHPERGYHGDVHKHLKDHHKTTSDIYIRHKNKTVIPGFSYYADEEEKHLEPIRNHPFVRKLGQQGYKVTKA